MKASALHRMLDRIEKAAAACLPAGRPYASLSEEELDNRIDELTREHYGSMSPTERKRRLGPLMGEGAS